jgi:glycogen synthase
MKGDFPKILMLGWEFPPIINGGLGVACHDLSCAMSDLADITMIVPKTTPGFRVKKLNLMGVNQVNLSELKNYPSNYHRPLPFKLESVPADLDPYYSLSEEHDAASSAKRAGYFDIDSLYGGDVIGKVMQYADITSNLAQDMDFDVIHAHDWMTMIAGIRIKQISGKPLVMHIHSLEVDRSGPDSKGWVYELEKKGMEYADMVVPVSNFTAENIRKYYGIEGTKMSVVHNGASNVTPFKSHRTFREKTVLFVGRLTRQKGPERFLDIAAKVLDSNPEVRFVMAGVGDYFRSCLENSAYKSIGNRFHMTGFLNSEKLRYLFSMSDIYCMPSISEPFGLSAVEAAQFGIPCVISRQSGVAEVLTGALKFDYWDVDKAAGCILSLLNDRVLREKVVEDASRNLHQISWDESARKLIHAYQEKQFI